MTKQQKDQDDKDMKNNSNGKKSVSSNTRSRNDTVIGESTLVRNLQAGVQVHPVVADNNSNNNGNNNANVHVHIIPLDTTTDTCIDASDSYRSRKDTHSVPCVKRTTGRPCLPMKKRIKCSSNNIYNSATDSCVQGTTEKPMVNHGYDTEANNDVQRSSISDVTLSYTGVNHRRLTSSCKRTVNISPSIAENDNSQILLETDDIDDIPVDFHDDDNNDDEILSMVLKMDDTRRLGNEIGAKYIIAEATALKERLSSYLLLQQQQEDQQTQQAQEQEIEHKGSIVECLHDEQQQHHPSVSIQTNDDSTTTTTLSDFCTDLLEVERQSILTQATKIRYVSIQFRTINSMYKKLMDELLMTDK